MGFFFSNVAECFNVTLNASAAEIESMWSHTDTWQTFLKNDVSYRIERTEHKFLS